MGDDYDYPNGRRERICPLGEQSYIDARLWCNYCNDVVLRWCQRQGHVAYCERCRGQYNTDNGCMFHPYEWGFNLDMAHKVDEFKKMKDDKAAKLASGEMFWDPKEELVLTYVPRREVQVAPEEKEEEAHKHGEAAPKKAEKEDDVMSIE